MKRSRMTVHDVLTYLENIGHFDSADVCLEPPGGTLTDEDSGDEDTGGCINNLSGNQLRVEAHATISFKSGEVEFLGENEDYITEDGHDEVSEVIVCSPDVEDEVSPVSSEASEDVIPPSDVEETVPSEDSEDVIPPTDEEDEVPFTSVMQKQVHNFGNFSFSSNIDIFSIIFRYHNAL